MVSASDVDLHYCQACDHPHGYHSSERGCSMPLGLSGLPIGRNEETAMSCGCRGVMTGVPNKPKTPIRSFRIPDETYASAQRKAAEKGESVSDVVRRALERYAKR